MFKNKLLVSIVAPIIIFILILVLISVTSLCLSGTGKALRGIDAPLSVFQKVIVMLGNPFIAIPASLFILIPCLIMTYIFMALYKIFIKKNSNKLDGPSDG